MKKLFALILSLALILTSFSSALAINFTGELGNEATFETLQEASASSPDVVRGIVENGSKVFVEHPVLEGYPEGTTFVYRSANQYAGRAAARLNTNLIVYADQKFESKDAAYAYLKDAGLIDIIDEAIGSIVLVTPIGAAFDKADVPSYYALQTAMLSQKASGKDAEGNTVNYASAEYFGGYGYVYFIGIGGGATFFNNFVAPEIDFVGRIAGALLIGGDMQEIRKPVTFVPVYFVDGKDEIVAKYKAVNGVDATRKDGDKLVSYNQAWPLRKVVVNDGLALADAVKDAYYNLFVKAMRVPVLTQAIVSGGSPFSGYNFDEAPYSLCDRNILIDGKTADDIYLIKVQGGNDAFAAYKMPDGEYIDVWYEYLPKEVLENTAAPGSIPLILANHGGGDDARVFVEEFGLLELAGKERIALVAPDHQRIADVRGPALTAVVEYMLAKYPALDASRVYATGYSMGGSATNTVGYYSPKTFAAVAPFAGPGNVIPEDQVANFDGIELPMMFGISSYDSLSSLSGIEGNISERTQTALRTWAGFNGIEIDTFDFDSYRYFGLDADLYVIDTINDEFERNLFYLYNDEGEPRIALTYLKGLIHALYPEYGQMFWDFVKVFSRDQVTGEIVYNPYAE